jgi:hypothetical protein
MPTEHREDGFRFMIYVDDHEPAHVHVFREDDEAKIQLGDTPDEVDLVKVWGMSMRDVRRALAIAERRHKKLLTAWRKHHG